MPPAVWGSEKSVKINGQHGVNISLGNATRRFICRGARGTPPQPRPSPRELARASGGLGSPKSVKTNGQHGVNVSWMDATRRFNRRGERGTPPLPRPSPRDPAHASGGSGPPKKSLNEGVSMHLTNSVRATHRNLSPSWTNERKAPLPDPARRPSEGYGTTLFADFAS